MHWFVFALAAPILHAAVNHIDKYLVSKFLKGSEVGSLVLFSSLFGVFALPIIAILNPNVFQVGSQDALVLTVNGALLVFAYILYFYALARDEASVVAPLFQMIPVFGFVLGYFFLGESLSLLQIAGSTVILVGSVVLALKTSRKNLKLKLPILVLMIGSSILYALNGVLFKFATAVQSNFWPSLFWDFTGKALIGVIIFTLVKSYRHQFLNVLVKNKRSALALNGLNEVLGLLGEGALFFATLLAPVALVQVVGGFQPLFVFVYGVMLTFLFPKMARESLDKKSLLQKLAGILIIVAGSLMVNL